MQVVRKEINQFQYRKELADDGHSDMKALNHHMGEQADTNGMDGSQSTPVSATSRVEAESQMLASVKAAV